jgi:hypothetical protein
MGKKRGICPYYTEMTGVNYECPGKTRMMVTSIMAFNIP